MTLPTTAQPRRGHSRPRLAGLVALAAILAGIALLSPGNARPLAAAPPPSGTPKETLVGGKPLWDGWPNKKPDAVIVLTGQTFGYLQPCGCSRPQIGGLERRAVLINSLKAKGWPVVGVDLGDLFMEKPGVARQGLLKYAATMHALREMGYIAVGVGQNEIRNDLWKQLAEYALKNPKELPPFVLAGNVEGVADGKRFPRADYFPAVPGGTRAMVEAVEVGKAGEVPVGVAGVVSKALQEENQKQKWDLTLDFPNAKGAIEDALKGLAKHPLQPRLNVLLWQGDAKTAAAVAQDFPQFHVILCQTEDGAPAPMQPQAVVHKNGTQTLVVQVGHKGQNVGVLGAFKKNGGGFEFKYQLVPLDENFITPGGESEALKNNKALQVLEDYAQKVKNADLMPRYPRTPHPAQIHAAALKPPVILTYAGSELCKACHTNEYEKWEKHAHGHAMDTLEKVAKRPGLRNFDAECVQCHTVGFHNQTGAYDAKNNAAQNKLLHHVGCESCHGPGSGHVAAPKSKDLLALMSPWKQPMAAKLPDAAFMKKMADMPDHERGKVAMAVDQQRLLQRVEGMCTKCHDYEADPKFDLYKSWPKVDHTGLAPKGGWPAAPPAKK